MEKAAAEVRGDEAEPGHGAQKGGDLVRTAHAGHVGPADVAAGVALDEEPEVDDGYVEFPLS